MRAGNQWQERKERLQKINCRSCVIAPVFSIPSIISVMVKKLKCAENDPCQVATFQRQRKGTACPQHTEAFAE